MNGGETTTDMGSRQKLACLQYLPTGCATPFTRYNDLPSRDPASSVYYLLNIRIDALFDKHIQFFFFSSIRTWQVASRFFQGGELRQFVTGYNQTTERIVYNAASYVIFFPDNFAEQGLATFPDRK